MCDVTSCGYAGFVRALDEAEIDALLLCDSNRDIVVIGGSNLERKRWQTIMHGARYCDFRRRLGGKG